MGAGVIKKAHAGGRRRRSARGKHAMMSEINVTPFVDVMLVLLIIFMVAAPLMTVGVPLELPRTAAQAMPGEPEEPLTISLTLDGRIMVMNSEVAEEDLSTRLRAVAAERVSNKLYLRADGAIPYERVVQLMGALNAGGYSNIVLVTDVGGPRLSPPAAGN
jgi:biopolymer transport protein TolR